MQAFQFWKTVMPTLTSRITHNIRPQIRTTSWILSLTSSSRACSSSHSSLFSSLSTTTRPVLSSNNTAINTTATNPMVVVSALSNQIRSFSASASLAGKRATYRPSRLVQKRRHGFLARLRTRTGRKILMRRRLKGRKDLSW